MIKNRGGFTLIELLVVIAVLAVLAAGVITAINPAKRTKQANDAKIKSDIGQIATGLQAYYTTNIGMYPAPPLTALETSGDLKKLPAGPGGTCAAYAYSTNPSPCVAGGVCEAQVNCTLQDTTTGELWCWKSSSGLAAKVAAGACTP